jgi:ferrous iron transport protein B
VETSARSGKGLDELKNALENVKECTYEVKYNEEIENAIKKLMPYAKKYESLINSRFLCLHLIDRDLTIESTLLKHISLNVENDKELFSALEEVKKSLSLSQSEVEDEIVKSVVKSAEELTKGVIKYKEEKYSKRDEKLDKILTGKIFAFPCMALLLALVFYITITLANYPSELLSMFFGKFEEWIRHLLTRTVCPSWLCSLVCTGVIRVVGWIISVMLPPMAIFFPLFTLLEDWGYLPRVAFNLDKVFHKCSSCGKQSLTMCMGFGCNAAGVVGCRIIDSERERLIAVLTNSFVPCNGRFPAMITLITVFFVSGVGFYSGILSASILSLVIIIGILFTFLSSKLLSKTLLKGSPSSFVLEMPSYRRPQILKTLVRSIFDRTLFVLARAVAVAIPSGVVIWLLSNITLGDVTILSHISSVIDPFGKALGMDGVIIMAFILGLPANEIVIPIAIMAYTSSTSLSDISDAFAIGEILTQNGWTYVTAICVIVFSLMHSPCTTTLSTIKKETGSIKWTLIAALLPTLFGITVCFLINLIFSAIM